MDVEALLDMYELTSEDLEHLKVFGELASERMDGVIDDWYAWLQQQDEFDQFFSDPDTLARVQSLQKGYWNDFLAAEVTNEYVAARARVGETHARIGLPISTYFAGMNKFLELFGPMMEEVEIDGVSSSEVTLAVGKLLHFDTSIVVETYNEMVEETLTAQSKSLLEMSTPVTQIWNGILLLPIVGLIDSTRARDIMNATLAKIGETQARIFILDISGVGVVDTAVANNLIKITRATRLMGCETTISGVSPSIAQTIVDLGIDVGRIKTTATMKDALSSAFERIGMQITRAQ